MGVAFTSETICFIDRSGDVTWIFNDNPVDVQNATGTFRNYLIIQVHDTVHMVTGC